MNFKEIIFLSIGGLGMFLFGMKFMSEGLQKIAGNKLRHFLNALSSNRIIAALFGTGITALIQSSSLTTVTVVGFVNAGLMNLTQAIGIILGANIGTTITAQIIAFKLTSIVLMSIFIGMCLKLFSKKRKWKYIGEVFLGFGFLFYGLDLMKSGFDPLHYNPKFISFFSTFEANSLDGIFLCIAVGALMTMVLQSSSATVGITMALASQGFLTFSSSVALILGDNIGTTVTGELAAIGGNISSKRAARAHTLFNIIGVIYIVIFFKPFLHLVCFFTQLIGVGSIDFIRSNEKVNIARYIANSHTLFNVLNASFFLLILPFLVKFTIFLTPNKKNGYSLENLSKPKYLDNKFLKNPSIALNQARSETIRMTNIAQTMYHQVTEVLFTRKVSFLNRWRESENALDNLQREITKFLIGIREGYITTYDSYEIASLMRMANNIERLGDAIENVAQLIEEMIENNLQLTIDGMQDYREIRDKVAQFIELVLHSMLKRDRHIMEIAQGIEDSIDKMRERMRHNHVERLRNGSCAVDPGLLFVDILSNFEKMGDYLYNISQAVAGVR